MPSFIVHLEQWAREITSVVIEGESAEEVRKTVTQRFTNQDPDFILDLDWADGDDSKDFTIRRISGRPS